jgi:hypothetical protein
MRDGVEHNVMVRKRYLNSLSFTNERISMKEREKHDKPKDGSVQNFQVKTK